MGAVWRLRDDEARARSIGASAVRWTAARRRAPECTEDFCARRRGGSASPAREPPEHRLAGSRARMIRFNAQQRSARPDIARDIVFRAFGMIAMWRTSPPAGHAI